MGHSARKLYHMSRKEDEYEVEHGKNLVWKWAGQMEKLYVTGRERYIRMKDDGDFFVPKVGGRNVLLKRDAIYDHIGKASTMGVYAGTKGSRFICFDVDDGGWESVQAVMSSLNAIGIPDDAQYVSLSGSKGYHVEVFFDGIVDMEHLWELYSAVIRLSGLSQKQVEFRPTQTMGVKLPLGTHLKTGVTCWFVDRKTGEAIENYDYLMEIRPMKKDRVLALIGSPSEGKMEAEGKEWEGDRAEPACGYVMSVNNFAPLKQKHTRHNAMVNIAMHCRAKGILFEECRKLMTEWYELQDKSLISSSPEAVFRDIDRIVDWAYQVELASQDHGGMSKQVSISKWELMNVVRQHSKAARKIFFCIAVREKAHHCAVSMDRLAECLGIHAGTVSAAIRKMLSDGEIRSVAGKNIRHPDGNFYRQPTAYYIADKGSEGYHTQDDAQTVMVSLREVETNGAKAFYRALGEMFDMRMLVELLNKTELLEYLDYTDQIMEEMIRAHGGTSRGANAQSEVAACGGEAETRGIGASADRDADTGGGAAAENGVSGEDIQATQCGYELPASAEGWQQCGNDGRRLSQAADVPDAV